MDSPITTSERETAIHLPSPLKLAPHAPPKGSRKMRAWPPFSRSSTRSSIDLFPATTSGSVGENAKVTFPPPAPSKTRVVVTAISAEPPRKSQPCEVSPSRVNATHRPASSNVTYSTRALALNTALWEIEPSGRSLVSIERSWRAVTNQRRSGEVTKSNTSPAMASPAVNSPLVNLPVFRSMEKWT